MHVVASPATELVDSAATADTTGAAIRRPLAIEASALLRRAYAAHNWSPFWVRGGALTPAAVAMLRAIAGVQERGLEADDYALGPLSALASRLSVANDSSRLEFDAALSASVVQLLHDLRSGRVAPGDAHLDLRLPEDSTDLAGILATLAASTTPDAVLDAQEPRHAAYQSLKRALARYREFTLADPTMQVRVDQITLAMERWRWLPRRFSAPPVIVNIAAFRLAAWQRVETDSGALTMDVIVGDALRHRTPVFADSLQFLVFAPYWIVPASIAAAELVPIGLRDPRLLTLNNYEIVAASGRVMPATVAAVRAVQRGRAFIRQRPGGTNALGRVKFMFPNAFDIYLHDTPALTEFARARRDISHGCIRVGDPAALALFLLRAQPGWNATAVRRALASVTPHRVDLPAPVPLYLLYITAESHADGRVTFHDDVYAMDAPLLALMSGGRARVPQAGVEAGRNILPR